MTISVEEKEKRRRKVRDALVFSTLDALGPSPEAKRLHERYINVEIEVKDMIEAIKFFYSTSN